MPRRIIILCGPCTKKAKRDIEIHEVTFWIDEDRVLYLIANCDCGSSQTVKTSAEALQEEYFHREVQTAPAPQHVM
jgi:energy-coupling factor transporter ATP-binding protein EcfA2